jgi:hypothetical protein
MALFARNAFILGSPTFLFLTGIPTAGFRLASSSVTQEQERQYGWTFLIGAAILTMFTTWANVAEFVPHASRLFSGKCQYPNRVFPCRKELTALFAFIFLFAMHPVVLSAGLLYVNESDWKDKDTIKRWIWALLIVSVLIYCANGILRQGYWFGHGF